VEISYNNTIVCFDAGPALPALCGQGGIVLEP